MVKHGVTLNIIGFHPLSSWDHSRKRGATSAPIEAWQQATFSDGESMRLTGLWFDWKIYEETSRVRTTNESNKECATRWGSADVHKRILKGCSYWTPRPREAFPSLHDKSLELRAAYVRNTHATGLWHAIRGEDGMLTCVCVVINGVSEKFCCFLAGVVGVLCVLGYSSVSKAWLFIRRGFIPLVLLNLLLNRKSQEFFHPSFCDVPLRESWFRM